MFTGIVEELGRVRSVTPHATGARLEIEARVVLEDAFLGCSIAVNGVCLTAVEIAHGWWAADAVEETLRRSALGRLRAGDQVNLERPVRLADRLGGHLVQGHVDDVGTIEGREYRADGSLVVRIRTADALPRYIVEKGSITVDGISLTVVAVDERGFSVALIPHTQSATTLGSKEVGAQVNLEVDMIAKYIERLIGASAATVSREDLRA